MGYIGNQHIKEQAAVAQYANTSLEVMANALLESKKPAKHHIPFFAGEKFIIDAWPSKMDVR